MFFCILLAGVTLHFCLLSVIFHIVAHAAVSVYDYCFVEILIRGRYMQHNITSVMLCGSSFKHFYTALQLCRAVFSCHKAVHLSVCPSNA